MVGNFSLLCKNLSKTYKEPDGDHVALRNVSFSLMSKDILFLCGPNGSGKTTLLKLIAGTEDKDEGGEILFSLPNTGLLNWSEHGDDNFTWIPQDVDDVIADHMRIDELISLCDMEKVKSLSEAVQANWLKDCLEGRSKRKLVSELSGGQKQLLVGIIAISPPKSVLLLDEVFKSLDTNARSCYWRMLEKSVWEFKGCVIIVSHDLPFALQHATRIIVLRNGEVAVDTKPTAMTLEQLALEVAKLA
jgi:ABC-type multidrug transport system ATPase subunit